MGKHSFERARLAEPAAASSQEALISRWGAVGIAGAQALAATTQLAAAGSQIIGRGFAEGLQIINPATVVDSIHNIGDVIGWVGHTTLDSRNFLTDDPVKRRRLKLGTYATVSTMGGISMAEGARKLVVPTHDYAHTYANIVGGAMSLGAAALTAAITYSALRRKGYTRLRDAWKTKNDKKMAIHAGSDMATATAAFVSTLPNMPQSVANIASIVGGATLAYTFRWTRNNLEDDEHHCAVHGHHHHDHDDDDRHAHDHIHHHDHTHDAAHHHEPVAVQELLPSYKKRLWVNQLRTRGRHRPEKQRSWWRRPVAVGSMAVVACIGASGTIHESPLPALTVPKDQTSPSSVAYPDLYASQYVAIRAGDSQWSIASEKITDATSIKAPREQDIYEIARQIAQANAPTYANPNVMYPGDVLNVPSVAAIQSVVAAPLLPHGTS